jgi:very-short-patch-repair endonuclease
LEPFHVRDARAAGVGEGRLRGRDLERPFHGVRLVGDTAIDTGINYGAFPSEQAAEEYARLVRRCLAYSQVLKPGQHFSHVTAARLWKVPLARPFSADEPLHVSVTFPRRAPEGRGIIGHQTRTQTPVADRYGFPTSDPASAWVELAASLDLDDLVAAGDHLVLDPYQLDPYDIRPHCSIADLENRLVHARVRGAPLARRAVLLVRQGAESRPETLLRLVLRRARLPEPELARDVYDDNGRWLARVDLYFDAWKVVVEYDGEQHRTDSRQYARDEGRIDALLAAGYTVVKIRKEHLFRRPEIAVIRVTDALRGHGWRPDR